MWRRMRSEGLSRGLLGGSRTLLVLGGVAWTVKAVRWAMQREVEVIAIGELEPGASYLITQRPPGKGRRRRR